MTTTDTRLTRQKVAAILKKSGMRAGSEGRNGRIGYATRSTGFSVTDNGERVYTCKLCGRSDAHRQGCKATGAAKYWRTRLVTDGTVTVAFIVGCMDHGRYSREDRDRIGQHIVMILTEAGLTVTPTGADAWTVSA